MNLQTHVPEIFLLMLIGGLAEGQACQKLCSFKSLSASLQTSQQTITSHMQSFRILGQTTTFFFNSGWYAKFWNPTTTFEILSKQTGGSFETDIFLFAIAQTRRNQQTSS